MKKRLISLKIIIWLTIILMLLNNTSRAVTLNGTIDTIEPDWFKISSGSNELIEVQVQGYGVAGDVAVGVAITLGMAADFWETMSINAAAINSTKSDASLSYQNSQGLPVYLVIFLINGSETVSINYNLDCSHNISSYSYQEYYNNVILPQVITYTALIGVTLGFAATVVTIYFIRRWRRTKRAS